MHKTIGITLLITALLGGCVMSNQELKSTYANTSDRALCMKYMTSPSMNVHQGNRRREIARRGVDCWKYGNVAEEKAKAERRYYETLCRLPGSNCPTNRNSPSGYVTCQNLIDDRVQTFSGSSCPNGWMVHF